MIQRICQLLKDELLDNGYEYGFYLNGKTYKPDMSNGFDEEFFGRLLSEYRIQNPQDTRQAKVGTCNDIVVLMKAILDEQNVPSKIWLLHNKQSDNFHTVLTFYIENKTIYLELTPQSAKPWYGKEIVFDNEQSFISEYSKDGCEVIDITDSVVVGEAPEFILSRMDQSDKKQHINVFGLLSFIIAIIAIVFGVVTSIAPFVLFALYLFIENSFFLYGSIAAMAIVIIFSPIISLIGYILGVISLNAKDKSVISIVGLITNAFIYLLSSVILLAAVMLVIYVALVFAIIVLLFFALDFFVNQVIPPIV